MEVKEAIEFANEIFNDWENIYCTSTGVNIEANKKLKQVIELLQRGEKYEAIVKEIKYEIDWHRPEREVHDSGSKGDDEYINETLDLIDKIEQKYFPKPIKKVVTVEIKGDTERVNLAINGIRDSLDNRKGIKVNVVIDNKGCD